MEVEKDKKSERKANFSDEEVRALLEAIGAEKDVILSKFQSSITMKKKRKLGEGL